VSSKGKRKKSKDGAMRYNQFDSVIDSNSKEMDHFIKQIHSRFVEPSNVIEEVESNSNRIESKVATIKTTTTTKTETKETKNVISRKRKLEEKKENSMKRKKIKRASAEKLIEKISAEMQLLQGNTVSLGSLLGGNQTSKQTSRFSGGGETKLRDDEMRRLIQQVPTDKARAFAYEIDWSAVKEHQIIEKKLRPWVKKKVTEYLGAEEQGMIEFIMRKVSSQSKPDLILAELEGFLDEEAENFTLKMWRMLIFEVLRVKAR